MRDALEILSNLIVSVVLIAGHPGPGCCDQHLSDGERDGTASSQADEDSKTPSEQSRKEVSFEFQELRGFEAPDQANCLQNNANLPGLPNFTGEEPCFCLKTAEFVDQDQLADVWNCPDLLPVSDLLNETIAQSIVGCRTFLERQPRSFAPPVRAQVILCIWQR